MEIIQLSSLDHYFADFITRIEGRPREGLWVAAALTSAVSCRGDVCLDLQSAAAYGITPFRPESVVPQVPSPGCWAEQLADCHTVGSPGEYTPLVLDAAGRLYLHRSWDFERRVAEGILARTAPHSVDTERYIEALDRFFPPAGDAIDLQREAAQAAILRRFAVISGGPGTGKTATVSRILALLVELAGDQAPVILLAAPTGKAAMRLKQSISHSVAQLPITDSVRSALPLEVTTIHRLLGVVPGQSGFRHDQSHPLRCDVLVVDEASMVDLPLMARLLDALPVDAKVILLGDRDQLSSVEAGAVMSDICAGACTEPALVASPPAVVQLTRSYRFTDQSGIGALSRLIKAGDGAGALELLTSRHHGDVCWRSLPAENSFAQSFREASSEGYANFARADSPSAALDELERFRVLTPHREGCYGVVSLNRLAAAAVPGTRRGCGVEPSLLPVMVTGNNYELGLYNGDIGIVQGWRTAVDQPVYFPGPDSSLRCVSSLRLPPHEAAFVLTVHKSQGSEFDRVLLILPGQFSEVLTRELLYTAVTRARTRVEIWGVEDVFCRAVERSTERRSGLADRLRKEVWS